MSPDQMELTGPEMIVQDRASEFQKELETVINRYSIARQAAHKRWRKM